MLTCYLIWVFWFEWNVASASEQRPPRAIYARDSGSNEVSYLHSLHRQLEQMYQYLLLHRVSEYPYSDISSILLCDDLFLPCFTFRPTSYSAELLPLE